MDAVVVRRGENQPTLIDKPRPTPETGEALVRTLRVGVDGTDTEVLAGEHGSFPAGEDHLVLGHEAVGVVADANGTDLMEGDLVVPTVRRPPASGETEQFRLGQPDMAPPDETLERGIDGAHGFMAEYFTSPAEYLVPAPDGMAEYGFLVEPISITEKAVEHAVASRSAFDWRPEAALVLGNGPLGLLTTAMFETGDRFTDVYCLGRRNRPDPTIDIIESLGVTYVDSRETPVETVPETHREMDLVYEATGHARHAFEGFDAVAPGGVLALLGVPCDWQFEVDGGRIHRETVLGNKAVVGSVNSHRTHFRAALETLDRLPSWVVDDIVTGVHPHTDPTPAFDTAPDETIKTAVEFHRP
jgi:threonine dehydrogenase-like Zn-dependent dehydrogenase